MNPNNRAPKRPINHYEEVNEVECLHDIPVTHIRRRGKWIPYVSNLFNFSLNLSVKFFVLVSLSVKSLNSLKYLYIHSNFSILFCNSNLKFFVK